jgi:hypothetical protein
MRKYFVSRYSIAAAAVYASLVAPLPSAATPSPLAEKAKREQVKNTMTKMVAVRLPSAAAHSPVVEAEKRKQVKHTTAKQTQGVLKEVINLPPVEMKTGATSSHQIEYKEDRANGLFTTIGEDKTEYVIDVKKHMAFIRKDGRILHWKCLDMPTPKNESVDVLSSTTLLGQ